MESCKKQFMIKISLKLHVIQNSHVIKVKSQRKYEQQRSEIVQWFDIGTSLVAQWLRLHAPNAGGPGSGN